MLNRLRGLDMENCPDKLTRVVFQYDNLSIRLHVRLFNDKHQPFHTEFDYNGKTYAKLDVFSFLTIDIKDKENKSKNDLSGSIMLMQSGLNQVLATMNDFIHAIYVEKIFACKRNGEVTMYDDMAIKFSKEIRVVGTNSNIGMTPAIIYDESTQLTYEGGVIYINKRRNQVALPITYLEGLYYTLNRIDLFRDSQLLLNYYVAYYNPRKFIESLIEKQSGNKKLRPKINFSDDLPKDNTDVKSEVIANFRSSNSEDELFHGIEE